MNSSRLNTICKPEQLGSPFSPVEVIFLGARLPFLLAYTSVPNDLVSEVHQVWRKKRRLWCKRVEDLSWTGDKCPVPPGADSPPQCPRSELPPSRENSVLRGVLLQPSDMVPELVSAV